MQGNVITQSYHLSSELRRHTARHTNLLTDTFSLAKHFQNTWAYANWIALPKCERNTYIDLKCSINTYPISHSKLSNPTKIHQGVSFIIQIRVIAIGNWNTYSIPLLKVIKLVHFSFHPRNTYVCTCPGWDGKLSISADDTWWNHLIMSLGHMW